MKHDKPAFDNLDPVSEDLARRILTRAAALDARAEHSLSLAQVRDIAAEAGIDARAFDQALAELRTLGVLGSDRIETSLGPERGLLTRLWRRVTGAEDVNPNSGARWTNFVPDAAVLGVFACLLVAVNQLANGIGMPWPLHDGLVIAANILGVGLALRWRGRVAGLVLAVAAAASLSSYLMHLLLGRELVHGPAGQAALLIAGLSGLVFGLLFAVARHSPPAIGSHGHAESQTTDAESADLGSTQPPPSSAGVQRLLLRHI